MPAEPAAVAEVPADTRQHSADQENDGLRGVQWVIPPPHEGSPKAGKGNGSQFELRGLGHGRDPSVGEVVAHGLIPGQTVNCDIYHTQPTPG